ncbi:MAG TPA: Rieske 2Fe-2S domain-containing protein [Methylomirabilota bacterium]|nr:Rieske 2Fe-2S domain-containing protein [Methylomirabilota bacterium]
MTFTPKWKFDAVLAAIILVWFVAGRLLFRGPDLSVFLTQASATLAFLFLSATLSLGPLARLWRPATHFIFNRRHLGVTTWALATFHASMVMHYGAHWKPSNLLIALPEERFLGIPFPLFGVAALAILSAMAATSWDRFLHAWGPAGWKRLHMLVYGAYGLLVIHALTRLASDPGPIAWKLSIPLFAVVGTVATLHLAAALKEARRDRAAPARADGLVPLGDFSRLQEGQATTAFAEGERIAIVRFDGALYALSNACPHQNGPLGEGRVRDGYLECPWHGYQFDPRTGQSPPGFSDFVPTYPIVTIDGVTYLKRSGAVVD